MTPKLEDSSKLAAPNTNQLGRLWVGLNCAVDLQSPLQTNDPWNLKSGPNSPVSVQPQLGENFVSQVADEVMRRLAALGSNNASNLLERARLDRIRDYVERKLYDAFNPLPYVKSVSYEPKTDQWMLVILFERQDKSEACMDLIGKLCDITRDDFSMPIFEPWILHVSEADDGIHDGHKFVIKR